MSDTFVLTEDEALELLSFLVTAARTQVDEPHEYASMRLLAASRRLSDFIVDRVSADTRQLLSGPFKQLAPSGTRTPDPEGYVANLDSLCSAVANHLVTHFGLDRGST